MITKRKRVPGEEKKCLQGTELYTWPLISTNRVGARLATANTTPCCMCSQRSTSPWLALGAEYLALDLRMMFSWICDHSPSLLHLEEEDKA